MRYVPGPLAKKKAGGSFEERLAKRRPRPVMHRVNEKLGGYREHPMMMDQLEAQVDNVLFAKDVVTYAQRKGWYPKDKPAEEFDFAAACECSNSRLGRA